MQTHLAAKKTNQFYSQFMEWSMWYGALQKEMKNHIGPIVKLVYQLLLMFWLFINTTWVGWYDSSSTNTKERLGCGLNKFCSIDPQEGVGWHVRQADWRTEGSDHSVEQSSGWGSPSPRKRVLRYVTAPKKNSIKLTENTHLYRKGKNHSIAHLLFYLLY